MKVECIFELCCLCWLFQRSDYFDNLLTQALILPGNYIGSIHYSLLILIPIFPRPSLVFC
jgi:hypothetical protein